MFADLNSLPLMVRSATRCECSDEAPVKSKSFREISSDVTVKSLKSFVVDFSKFTDDGVFAIFMILVSRKGDSVDVVDEGGWSCVTVVSELKLMVLMESFEGSAISFVASFFLKFWILDRRFGVDGLLDPNEVVFFIVFKLVVDDSTSFKLIVGLVKFRGGKVRFGSVARLGSDEVCVGASVVEVEVVRVVEYLFRGKSPSSPESLVSLRLRRFTRNRLKRWLSGFTAVAAVELESKVEAVVVVDKGLRLYSLMLNLGRLLILFKTFSSSTAAVELG